MKRTTIINLAIGLFITPFLFSFLVLSPRQARAQDSGYLDEAYSREELAQMLAPIALYPDALLSQVLMASTYPIEVIEADRWIKRNPHLRGDALDDAMLAEDWDPSVKAICHFPSILDIMSARIAETTDIGNAFLAQEAEVMDMVQELRASAYARGNLTTNSRQKVVVEHKTIIIEPANPRVVYVPYYDPFHVYGSWWYPAYTPWYWGPSGVRVGVGLSYWPGFHFSFTYGTWSYFNWPSRTIYIDVHKRPRYVRHDRWVVKPGRWHHAPHHRRGVAYRGNSITLKYSQTPKRFRDYGRDTRGISGRRDLDKFKDRHGSERSRIERVRRGDDRPRVDRDRQKPQRIERERQMRVQSDQQKRHVSNREERNPAGPAGMERPKIERTHLAKERVERRSPGSNQQQLKTIKSKPARSEPLERDRPGRDHQKKERVEREKQVREQASRHQQRKTIDREKQERKPSGHDRQGQGRPGRNKDSF